MAAFANLRFLNVSSPFGVINMILSLGIIIAYLIIISVALLKHYKMIQKNKEEIIPLKQNNLKIQSNREELEKHEHEEEKEVEQKFA
jgi:hypothetical protein